MNPQETILLKKTRRWITVFILFLCISGITAFPLEWELQLLTKNLDMLPTVVHPWITKVYEGVQNTNTQYPFIFYGTDWLAFSHLVIAVAFIGPYLNPVKNVWVLQFGMIACVMIFPLALIAGQVRGIPFCWQLIDCSFGIFGLIPLGSAYRLTKKMELPENTSKNIQLTIVH